MNDLLRDIGFGLRVLAKHRGFTAVAVLTLALGIAANTAIYSVIHATYFAALPYRDAERLVVVWSRVNNNRTQTSPANFADWKRQATVFEDLGAWNGRAVNLSTAERPEQVQAGPATAGFLAMLGYGHPLALGRTFLEEEGTVGREQVAILTHRLWQERFSGDPAIIGRQIRIDGKPHNVVGVLGAGPADQNQVQIWLPLTFAPEQMNRNWNTLLVMGRLKPGVTFAQANANMEAVTRNLAAAYPDSNAGWGASVEPFRNNFVSDNTKASLWLLMGAVAFVLLIACANVANLLLARGSARQRELAVRAAIGASRAQIARQLITESLLLAFIGGVLGVALAAGLLDVIVALLPAYTLPTEVEIHLNLPVLLFTLVACTLSGVLAGCAPVWQAGRTNVIDTLKEAGRAQVGGRHGLRRALVVVEFALALTLLTGGGLALASFSKLVQTDLGFRPERLLTFTLPVAEGRLTGADQINAFYGGLIERVQALPGVASASVSTGLPLRGGGSRQFSIAGTPVPNPAERPRARVNQVSPEYHATLGIRITRGRAFSARDHAGSVPVAIVNERFVKQHLAAVDPLTQRILVAVPNWGGPSGPDVALEIVGVSADVRSDGPQDEGQAAIDVPFWQDPRPRARMAVRTVGDGTRVQEGIAAVIRSIDPDLPMGGTTTMVQLVADSMAADRFNTALFGTFAGLALLLAAVGIYGVMSFVVAQRTHELGLRMALGASRGQVVRHMLGEGMRTAFLGIAFGSVGAYLVARAMQGMVHGIGLTDPTAFIVVALTLAGAALVACLVPARRAASVDPMVALRQD